MVRIEEHDEEEFQEEDHQCERSSDSDLISTKRKRVPNSKNNEYVVDKTNGYCPGCNNYVEYSEEGVLCIKVHLFGIINVPIHLLKW